MIVITGASKGLGRAICERLIERNIDVFGLARNVEDVPFASMSCNVSSYESVKGVTQHLNKEGIKVSGLVNAVGIALINLAVTIPQSVAQKIINTNLLGTIYCCQLIAPLMLRNKHGSIIIFLTIAVALGLKGASICVFKGWCRGFYKVIR